MHTSAAGRRDGPQVALAPHDHICVGGERLAQLRQAERAHHEHPHVAQARLAQLARLASVGNAKPGGAAGERGAGALHRAVAVAVGLDDRAERCPGVQLCAQARAVARDRGDVDAGLRSAQASGVSLARTEL